MTPLDAKAHLRIARPSRDLAAVEQFWVQGLGLEPLYRVTKGHRLLMLGWPDAGWHLELVETDVEPRPTEEDLLVLYLGRPPQEALVSRLLAAGGRRVPARNPYWDDWGITFADPDGYRLVLSHRDW